MKNLWQKRWVRISIVTAGVFILLFVLRNKILTGIGQWLSAEDIDQQTEACFVLGGNSYERGNAAVEIAKIFPDQKFIASGGNFPTQILCLDTMMTEAELTRHWMRANGIPQENIEILTESHSTMEESEEILNYCKQHQLRKITVISSEFHIRRVRWVFQEKFEAAGIQILFHGADAMEYNAGNWWKNEEGLIMANNEMVKLFYYFLKY